MNSSLPLSFPSPPPGYVSLATIQPLVYYLLLSAVWPSMLVAMFFLMFYLSTPQIRRTPLFLMNVVAVVLGVVAGFTQVNRATLTVLYPNTPINLVSQRLPSTISVILPIYIDCILAVRLYVVYPRSMTSSLQLAIIFVPEIALKILRTINATYFLVRFFQHLDHDPSLSKAIAALLHETPCMQIEWIAGLVDNWQVLWASLWFLWRLRHDVMKSSSSIEIGTANGTARKISGHLQKLFYLGLSSFVFPCLLNIISVIICYKVSIFLNSYAYVFMANFYIQIVGVLLATIWVSKERSSQHSDSACPASLTPSLPFHAATVDPVRTWASENLPPSRTCCIEEQRMVRIDELATMQTRTDTLPSSSNGYIPPKETIV
ncbi:hypothetical protein DL96DRAFT_1820206 [Flagelloscypha sp. PMI_526]|nr:hypothetical protein DL96DRAFT_1820206 [Flagelloscypha sp. PMI_526]